MSTEEDKTIPVSVEGNVVHVQKSIYDRLSKTLSDHKLAAEVIGGVIAFAGIAIITAEVIQHRKHHSEDQEKPVLTPQQEEDFRTMYEQNYSKILGFLKFRGLSDDTAEDVTQHVFLRSYKHFAEFVPQAGFADTYSPWLFKIAHNLLLNNYRDTNRHPQQSLEAPLDINDADEKTNLGNILPDHQPSIEDQVIDLQDRERYAQAMKLLIPKYQLVIWLKSLDLSNKEIQYIFNYPTEGTVKSVYFRAQLALKKEMEKHHV